eukprot:NODE_1784_length_1069_cov_65.999020_g724_i1.p2 GENE.NODE_1784_length_1069_cov_65.999020_g724_i1~~NODE_1784_length_1069_cov_65.999020_g724_i1.p2  ORF type:complete len:67 (-),score=5.91 NODE_1784_length_1069_cov_65.999020_g724_i1:238-438(-)
MMLAWTQHCPKHTSFIQQNKKSFASGRVVVLKVVTNLNPKQTTPMHSKVSFFFFFQYHPLPPDKKK